MSRIIFGPFLSAILLPAPFLAPILFPAAWIAFVPLFWAIANAKSLRGAVFSCFSSTPRCRECRSESLPSSCAASASDPGKFFLRYFGFP